MAAQDQPHERLVFPEEVVVWPCFFSDKKLKCSLNGESLRFLAFANELWQSRTKFLFNLEL